MIISCDCNFFQAIGKQRSGNNTITIRRVISIDLTKRRVAVTFELPFSGKMYLFFIDLLILYHMTTRSFFRRWKSTFSFSVWHTITKETRRLLARLSQRILLAICRSWVNVSWLHFARARRWGNWTFFRHVRFVSKITLHRIARARIS